jgi:hypothetical protein
MKWLKIIDVTVQVAIAFIALIIWNQYSFAAFYFVLGGWQVLSCLVHFMVYPSSERSGSRRAYEKTLAWVVGIAAASSLIGYAGIEAGFILLFLLGCVMLFGGVLMAIWYCVDCFAEIKHLFNKNEEEQIHTL